MPPTVPLPFSGGTQVSRNSLTLASTHAGSGVICSTCTASPNFWTRSPAQPVRSLRQRTRGRQPSCCQPRMMRRVNSAAKGPSPTTTGSGTAASLGKGGHSRRVSSASWVTRHTVRVASEELRVHCRARAGESNSASGWVFGAVEATRQTRFAVSLSSPPTITTSSAPRSTPVRCGSLRSGRTETPLPASQAWSEGPRSPTTTTFVPALR